MHFQDFLEPGKPIYRIAVLEGKPEQLPAIDDLRPIAATEYRLIALAPGDLPILIARTPAVNFYVVNLNEPWAERIIIETGTSCSSARTAGTTQ